MNGAVKRMPAAPGRAYAAGVVTDRDVARWRLRSQFLAAPVEGAERAVRSLVGVQAENPSQSAWAVATRTTSPDRRDLAGALADGRVLRTHVLRPTWHYVHADDLHWLQELTSPRVLPVLEQQLLPSGERMSALADTVEELLHEAPDRTRPELAEALAQRGRSLAGLELTLLLAYLEVRGVITSGAPRDGVHTYAPFADRVPSPRRLERDEALAELALRYLTSHGPATDRDLAYWATLTLGDVRRGIAAAGDGLEPFEHDGRTFWHRSGEGPVAADPAAAAASVSPAAHLLQVLDEIYRGYQDSRWVIDADRVVPRGREGSIGMALIDGQLLAGMRRSVGPKAVAFEIRPFRVLQRSEIDAIRAAAGRYGDFLGVEAAVEFDDPR